MVEGPRTGAVRVAEQAAPVVVAAPLIIHLETVEARDADGAGLRFVSPDRLPAPADGLVGRRWVRPSVC
jgi:hypothetical protein